MPGNGTYFSHIALNMPEWEDTGRDQERIQTSISLDNESVDGCTYVVYGGHKTVGAWWKECKKRGQGKAGDTMKMNAVYTKEDERIYGELRPMICDAGDLRVSFPTIVHGSSGDARGQAPQGRVRRV